MKFTKEEKIQILDKLVDKTTKNSLSLNIELLENYKHIVITNVYNFYRYFIYPFNKFLRLLIKSKTNNSETYFLLMNLIFIQKHFQKLIIKKDGEYYSLDKTLTIIDNLFLYFEEDKKIELHSNLKCPQKIFTTQEEILEFYYAIKQLHVGDYEKYMEFIKKLNQI